LDFVVSGHNQDFTLLNIVGWGQLPTKNAWGVRVLKKTLYKINNQTLIYLIFLPGSYTIWQLTSVEMIGPTYS
jgi:uncharacterized RDD family membrane protein YckC